MALTFDATLKDMARDCPEGFLAEFDRLPISPLVLLNVDLAAVTRSADLVVGLGEPLVEVIHMEFQSSAAAWKHADILVYNALLYSHHHVPVHSVVLLLRPEAEHKNMTGHVRYAARPEDGKMDFGYKIVRLWEIDAERLLDAELGVVPLAVLGRLPDDAALDDSVAAIARRMLQRINSEASPDRAGKLLTKALLLAGLRVRRNVALSIFRGIPKMEESDTYLMILEEGEAKGKKKSIIVAGEERLGAPDASTKAQLDGVTDLERLDRMMRRAITANTWQDIIGTK